MKPPFPYYRGKTRVADQIVRALPPHRHYVEPFFGAGAVLFAKPPTNLETINDLNGDIVNFFRVLRDQPDALERACTLTPHSREEFANARDRDVHSDVERARRVFVTLSQGRNASLRKTGWAHFQNPGAMTNSGSRPSYIRTMIGRFSDVAERLLQVSIENRDALTLITEYGAHRDVLLYLDPPYLASTRASEGYEIEFARKDQHTELLDGVLACNAAVVLSGYDSDLYRQRLGGWYTLALTGARDVRSKMRREVLWSNRPFPSTLWAETYA